MSIVCFLVAFSLVPVHRWSVFCVGMEGRAGRWPEVGAQGGSDQRQQVPADAVAVVAVMPWFGLVRVARGLPSLPMPPNGHGRW